MKYARWGLKHTTYRVRYGLLRVALVSAAIATGITPLASNLFRPDVAHATATWQMVGSALSNDTANYTSMAIGPNNVPVVAYTDSNVGNAVEVKKFNGTSWVNIGADGISAGSASYTTLAIDSANTPYVAYADGTNGDQLTVLKWTGSAWTQVGGPASDSSVIDVSLVTGPSGTLYTSYRDGANGNKATVMKWDGSTWAPVGAAGLSTGEASFTSVALTSAGVPYVSYQDADSGNKATVMTFNGTSWVPAGSGQISVDTGNYSSMKMTTDDHPVVAYRDVDQSYKESVRTFDGTSWSNVGSLGFSADEADYGSLTLDSNDNPYVAYQDVGHGSGASVMGYDGSSWAPVGAEGFSAGSVTYTSLAIDGYNALYIAYIDGGTADKAVVMKYAPTYALSFDTQGGSTVSSINNQVGGASETLPTAPTRSGYMFAGWNTASNGSGTSYAAGASYTMPGNNTTLYAIWHSSTSAGIPISVENAGPNGGDANDDGTLDSTQPNVASFVNAVTGSYVAVAVDPACTLTSASIKQPGVLGTDTHYSYPLGLLDFAASCGTPGYATTVRQYYYSPSNDSFTLRKYVHNTYETVPSATLTMRTIGGENVLVVSYQATDGGALDNDSTANGVIVDPAGPAVALASGSLSDTGVNIIIPVAFAAGLAITALLVRSPRSNYGLLHKVWNQREPTE